MGAWELAALGAAAFFLQSSFFPFLFNGIMAPDIWLVIVALASIILDKKSSLVLAGMGGFLQDILAGNFFGLHLLPYLFISLLFITFGRHRYNRHWYVSFFAALLASVIYIVLSGFIMGWAGSGTPALGYFVTLGIPLTLMNGGCALILHPILWMLKREEEPRW